MKQIDYSQYEELRQNALKERGFDKETIDAFRKRIAKVSLDESKKLGEELLNAVSNDSYSEEDYTKKVTELILAGADLEAKDKKGNTGVILCAKKNLHKRFLPLARAGANVNAQNNSLSTACMWSTRKDNGAFLYDLILLGADINMQCKDGDNALNSSAIHNAITCARMLIEANVIINIKNNKGEGALHIAKAKGHLEICKMILSVLENTCDVEYQKPACSSEMVKQELGIARTKLRTISRI